MFIIAEIGQAHEGSLGLAHSYIDAVAGTGVDAVKFQTHIAFAESSNKEPFRINFSYEDATRYEYWKRMEFTEDQWAGLKKHCEEKGLEFISSPFSLAAVDLLDRIGVQKFKIGSGETQNYLMLEAIKRRGKDIILSSGMSSNAEIEQTIQFLGEFRNRVSLLQCTTAYPTIPGQWGLRTISELKERFKLPVGFSDHSGDIFACLAATALGAEILEFHVTFDKRMFGPDSPASLTIDETTKMVKGVRQVTDSLGAAYSKDDDSQFVELKKMFGKTLSLGCNVKAGELVQFSMLEARKPGGEGIAANRFQEIIGRKLTRDMKAGEFLQESDLDVS